MPCIFRIFLLQKKKHKIIVKHIQKLFIQPRDVRQVTCLWETEHVLRGEVKKEHFSVGKRTICPQAPTIPHLCLSTSPKMRTQARSFFYQHSLLTASPTPGPPCLPLQTLPIADSSCADEHNARAKAAQLGSLPTWHRFDLWHASRPPFRLLCLQPNSVCPSISFPQRSLPGRAYTQHQSASSGHPGQFNSNWG